MSADDDDVRAGVARHHAEQHALADAAAREQADALAAADGQQRIDRTHADVERSEIGWRASGLIWRAGQAHAIFAIERAEPVERLRRAVDDPAEQLRADAHRAGALTRHDARVRLEAMSIAGGHEIETVAGEADHFGFDARARLPVITSQ